MISIRIIVLSFLLTPLLSLSQSVAFQRNSELGQGMNLRQFATNFQDTSVISYVHHDVSDYAKMKLLGVDHIRIPTGFFFWTDTVPPYTIDNNMLLMLDTVINEIRSEGLKIILDFHNRIHFLNDTAYVQESTRIATAWKQITSRYSYLSPDSTFFEIYNEPYFITDTTWNYVVKESIDSIRTVDTEHTLILANNQDFIFMYYDGLNVPDTNVIFTIHHYLPFIFTHQGALWLDTPINTTDIPFPYDPLTMPALHSLDVGTHWENAYNDYPNTGNLTETRNRFIASKEITDSLGVPLYCGEFGCSKLAPIDSRLRWIEGVRELLDSLEIPWAHWNWKSDIHSPFECEICADLDSVATDSSGYNIFCALGLENCSFLSADEAKEDAYKIVLYPNPSNGIFKFSFPDFTQGVLSITNSSGQLLVKKAINEIEAVVDLSSCPSGVYFATVVTEDMSQSFKMILSD